MKYVKLYENFDFNDKDFDWDEEEDGIGEVFICIKTWRNGESGFYKGEKYELIDITTDPTTYVLDEADGRRYWPLREYFYPDGDNFSEYFRRDLINENNELDPFGEEDWDEEEITGEYYLLHYTYKHDLDVVELVKVEMEENKDIYIITDIHNGEILYRVSKWELEHYLLSSDRFPHLFKKWRTPEMNIIWRKLTKGGNLPKKGYKNRICRYI